MAPTPEPRIVPREQMRRALSSALRFAASRAAITSDEEKAILAHFDASPAPVESGPIPMLLFCPNCRVQHVDAPDPDGVTSVEMSGRETRWDNPPHRSHLCHQCGCVWRPADVPTEGVAAITTKGKADTWDLAIRAALTKPMESAVGARELLADALEWKDRKECLSWIDGALAGQFNRVGSRIDITKAIDAIERALSLRPEVEEGLETWESINQWCDDTFGAATVPQIIARAKEEFVELEADGADHAIEAADVVICLCRVPGFADALQRKMAINRKRKWRLTGEGTGYHIPEETASRPIPAEVPDVAGLAEVFGRYIVVKVILRDKSEVYRVMERATSVGLGGDHLTRRAAEDARDHVLAATALERMGEVGR